MYNSFIFITAIGWLAAVPSCVLFAGFLFGGKDSKQMIAVLLVKNNQN